MEQDFIQGESRLQKDSEKAQRKARNDLKREKKESLKI